MFNRNQPFKKMFIIFVLSVTTAGLAIASNQNTITYADSNFIHTEVYKEIPAGELKRMPYLTENRRRLSSIILNAGTNLSANSDALAAFNRAIDCWVSWFNDPVTVEIYADLQPLSGSILGGATSNFFSAPYTDVRDAMVSDADPTNETICNSLPTLAQYNMIIPNGFTFNDDNMLASKANFRALGFDMSFDTDPDVLIEFNLNRLADFDFDRSNGIDSDKYDFEGIVLHELGHALGFTSEVTYVDYLLADKLTDEVLPRPLDLFRLQPGDGASDFVNSARVLVPANYPGGSAIPTQVTFDGIEELEMSTGEYAGDGRQPSHWRDNSLSGLNLGLMDPTLGKGEQIKPTRNDIIALGLVGWDVDHGPCPGSPYDCNDDGIPLSAADLSYLIQYIRHDVTHFNNLCSFEFNFFDNRFFPCEPTYSDVVVFNRYLAGDLTINDINPECQYTQFPQKTEDLAIVMPKNVDLSFNRSETFTIQLKNNTALTQEVWMVTVPIEFPYTDGTGTATYSYSNFRDYGVWNVDEDISSSGKPAVVLYSTTVPVEIPALTTIDLFDVNYDWTHSSGTPIMSAAYFYEAPACVPTIMTNNIAARSEDNRIAPAWIESIPVESLYYYNCDALPGEADGTDPINILDIVYLINSVYKGGPDPVGYPLANGDPNSDCTINILDIVYLINFVYKDGPEPITCDGWTDACGLLH